MQVYNLRVKRNIKGQYKNTKQGKKYYPFSQATITIPSKPTCVLKDVIIMEKEDFIRELLCNLDPRDLEMFLGLFSEEFQPLREELRAKVYEHWKKIGKEINQKEVEEYRNYLKK